jgi:hypothetical protein
MKICKYLESIFTYMNIKTLYVLSKSNDVHEVSLKIFHDKYVGTSHYSTYLDLINAIKKYKLKCFLLNKPLPSSQYIHIYYLPTFVPNEGNRIKIEEIEP